MKRPAAWVALPALALVAWTVAPLAIGSRTLVLRDVLATHLKLRAGLAHALRAGELPLVDAARAGGQGLLGNPNAVALYPDNLLLLAATDLWQLNAHFWLHWLLALPATYGLARLWGLGRETSWLAAAFYAFSGYFLSQLNLYNAVAGAALAPALAAALLAAAEPRLRRWALPALGGLWALELVAGDPILAAVALLAAFALSAAGRRRAPWRGVAMALAAGSLVAAPQWVETLRLLPGSFRGVQSTGAALLAGGSPTPPALVELLLPLCFGRPDLGEAWANRLFGGVPPLYFSLAPGVLVLAALVAGASERGRRSRWTAGALVGGSVIAYAGSWIAPLLAGLPGSGLLRYPVKFALVGSLAACLLAARGVEQARDEPRAGSAVARALVAIAAGELALLGMTRLPEFRGTAAAWLAPGLAADGLADARSFWATTALVQLAVALAAWWLVRRSRWRVGPVVAALVALHCGSQWWTLRALVPTDRSAPYRTTPNLLSEIPPSSVTVHGAAFDLFGPGYFEGGRYPDRRAFWRTRRAHEELYSYALPEARRRTELLLSAEGLDAFPVQAAATAVRRLADADRLRLLAATGVDRLLVPRELDAAASGAATLLAESDGRPALRVYRIERPLAEVQLLGERRYAPHLNAALAAVLADDFDPGRDTVLSGDGPRRSAPPGTVEVERLGADEIELAVDSPAGGAVVVRRAWLSIWDAEVDGEPAPVRVANLTRLAVEVPAGPHRVRFFVSRRPFVLASIATALGIGWLIVLARPWTAGSKRGTVAP